MLDITTAIIVSCWAIFELYWLINAFSQKSVAEKSSFTNRFLNFIFMIIAFVFLIPNKFYLLSTIIVRDSQLVNVFSLALCVLGLVTSIWARKTLAGNWSSHVSFKKGHKLVQTGPYKFVRHPIYTGILLIFLGTALAIGRVSGFIGFVILFTAFWIKLKQEEVLMIKHFKQEYLDYKKRVKALIPYLF